MHDTINTVAAVASEFNAEETEDRSVNVDVALGVTKSGSTDGIVLDEFSLIVVPTTIHTWQILRIMKKLI